MNQKNFIAAFLFSLCPGLLFAQATLSVASAPAPGADIGLTELTGALTLTVISGTTVAAPFRIDYSAPITNNSASEISVTGSGGFSGVAPSPILDQTNNFILVNVPAGGISGNRISVQGVRVALASANAPRRQRRPTRVSATITGPSPGGNAIAAGQATVDVIGSIISPFTVDLTSDHALAFSNGIVFKPSATFVIREGFVNAFTSSVGAFGQTVPTKFRITPFPSIPDGVTLTFAAAATSPVTGATLATSSGADEKVPRADGSTSVVYEFSAAADSAVKMESFAITVTLGIEPPARTGTITFQTALFPIGAAKPGDEFPSADIPRYVERIVPDEAELATGSVELVIPFRAKTDAVFTGIALTNPLSFRVKVTLTALDANGNTIAGSDITNPVTLTLPRKGQIGKLATEIFGTRFNTATGGSIHAAGKTSTLGGFYLQGSEGGPQLDGAVADLIPLRVFALPMVFRQEPERFTLLEFFNPGSSVASIALTLFDSSGRSVSSKSLAVPSRGTVNRDLESLFSVNLDSFTGGYVVGRSDLPVVARQTFGNSLDSNVLTAQVGFQRSRIDVAHFATGGGFTTELNFVNLDAAYPAAITLTAVGDNGAPVSGGANPARLLLSPGAQVIRSVEDLFQIDNKSLTTGSVRIDIATISRGPFVVVPLIAGSVRFSSPDGARSASLPLFLPPAQDFVYSHIAQNRDFYTGVAALNTNGAPVPFTVEAFSQGGVLTGSFSSTLQPGQKIAKLILELIPAVFDHVGGYIRIRAGQPITSFSLFGDTRGLTLSTIPPQRID